MLEKLEKIEKRFQTISEQMADQQVTSDHSKYSKLAREYAELEEVVKKYQQ